MMQDISIHKAAACKDSLGKVPPLPDDFSEASAVVTQSTDTFTAIGLVFHADGQYGIAEDGKKVKLPGSGRLRARIAFPISSSELIAFHHNGIFRVSLRDRSQ